MNDWRIEKLSAVWLSYTDDTVTVDVILAMELRGGRAFVC